MTSGIRRGAVLAVVAVALVTPAAASGAGAEGPVLSIVGEGPLAVEAEAGVEDTKGYITVFNSGATAKTVEVELQAASSTDVIVKDFEPDSVGPASAERITIEFDGLSELTEPASGQLVVTGDVVPLAREATLTPAPQPSAPWPQVLVVIALAFTLGMMLVIAGDVRIKDRALLRKRATGPKWTFSSWATILTAVGAVLGTALGAVTLPDVPTEIDKATLVELNVLFLALIAIAPFVFYAIRAKESKPEEQAAGLTGYNGVLLFSCCLTCGAVMGQLGALALLAWELIGGGFWGWFAVVAIGLIAILALVYCFQTTKRVVTTDWEAIAKADAEAAKKAAASAGLAIQLDDLSGQTPIVDRVPAVAPQRPVLP